VEVSKGTFIAAAIIMAFVFVIIGVQLIDPLANSVINISGLAILGSFGGASALLDLLVIIGVSAVIIAAVVALFTLTRSTPTGLARTIVEGVRESRNK